MAEESRVREVWGGLGMRQVWLLGLTHFGLRFEVWRSLARRLFDVAAGLQSDTARGKVIANPRYNLHLASMPAWKKEAWELLQAEAQLFELLTDHPDEEVAELARMILGELKG